MWHHSQETRSKNSSPLDLLLFDWTFKKTILSKLSEHGPVEESTDRSKANVSFSFKIILNHGTYFKTITPSLTLKPVT